MTSKPTAKSNRATQQALHKQWLQEHGDEYRTKLLRNIKAQLPQLKKLLRQAEGVSSSGKDDDRLDDVITVIYRRRQAINRKIYTALQDLLPDQPMRKSFSQMVAEGIDQEFDSADSDDLFKRAQVVNAFVHAQFFLELACRKGRELKSLPDEADEDWGALLKLFDLR